MLISKLNMLIIEDCLSFAGLWRAPKILVNFHNNWRLACDNEGCLPDPLGGWTLEFYRKQDDTCTTLYSPSELSQSHLGSRLHSKVQLLPSAASYSGNLCHEGEIPLLSSRRNVCKLSQYTYTGFPLLCFPIILCDLKSLYPDFFPTMLFPLYCSSGSFARIF